MPKRRKVKLSKKELKYRAKMDLIGKGRPDLSQSVQTATAKRTISVPQVVAIRQLADLSGLQPTEIIQALFKNGIMATINESIDFETAVLVGDDLGLDIVSQQENNKSEIITKEDTSAIARPPIVTVMGHVDHGKTQLLDAIRQTDVVSTETAGITQHIGAYQVEVDHEGKKRSITFLDTPGHEAFSALRAHGANVTDIVILVVAADDGVKAQTLEAISHAKAAQVPIIVAINKIDLPAADPDRVKRELATHDLLAEDWGGKTPTVLVSAKEKTNIKQLLDMVLLVADLNELKGNPKANPTGVIIESHIDPGVGTLATALVNQGTLRIGEYMTVGNTWGKVRFLEDWRGNRVKEAGLSMPVRIAGIKGVPAFGDRFIIVDDEKTARKALDEKVAPQIVRSISQQGATNEFKLILRADVVGSLQAIKASLNDIPQDKITIKILSEGIGVVTEGDLNLAITADAHIYGFRVEIPKTIVAHAERNNITIKTFDTIYRLIEDLYTTIEGAISPEISEVSVGQLQVAKVFFQAGEEAIVGGKVISGKLTPGLKVSIMRDGQPVGQGKITSLKIGPTPTDIVNKNEECGIQLFKQAAGSYKIKENDIIDAIEVTKVVTKLTETRE